MNPTTPVIASFDSSQNVDFLVIRLCRAGISFGRISALTPRCMVSEPPALWPDLERCPVLPISREPVLMEGPLESELPGGRGDASVSAMLEAAGADHESACAGEESLEHGHALLCVHAEDEAEASIASRLLWNSAAEMISLGRGRPPFGPDIGDEMLMPA